MPWKTWKGRNSETPCKHKKARERIKEEQCLKTGKKIKGFSFMPIVLKTVGLLRRSVFVLPKGKCINLIAVFDLLHKSEFSACTSFDEQFGRIVLKRPGFTITCFRSGKVMVYGLAEDKEVITFLKLVWKSFFYKNTVKL